MSKRKDIIVKIASILSICLLTSTSLSSAHSGRTDSNGGHRDNKNKSGLGSYHYHHGYGPHLHTNGCPYGGGSTSSSSGSSSNSSSSSSSSSASSQINLEQQREREKEQVGTKGFNAGYSAGYNGEVSDSYYSGDYSDTYKSKYDEGYESGRAKLEDEKIAVEEKGYNLGLEGLEINENEYKNEELNTVYKQSYNEGLVQYQAKKVSEYTQLGLKDGQEDNEMIDLTDVDEMFATSYNDAYKQGQEILSNEYIEKGYNQALKNTQYTAPNYKNTKYVNWYKEGFDQGVKDVESAKQIGYDDGYSNKESQVPKDLEACEKVYLENYEKGKAQADEEAVKTVASTTGLIGAGWLIRRFLEAKKSIG